MKSLSHYFYVAFFVAFFFVAFFFVTSFFVEIKGVEKACSALNFFLCFIFLHCIFLCCIFLLHLSYLQLKVLYEKACSGLALCLHSIFSLCRLAKPRAPMLDPQKQKILRGHQNYPKIQNQMKIFQFLRPNFQMRKHVQGLGKTSKPKTHFNSGIA